MFTESTEQEVGNSLLIAIGVTSFGKMVGVEEGRHGLWGDLDTWASCREGDGVNVETG